ncbi:MAG: hypothetical protein ACC707_02515 [Thiohalomonadales bacterium]
MLYFIKQLALSVRIISLFVLISALLLSCSSNDDNPSDPTVANPTYYGEIAPLFYKNCVSCHKNGGIAPFSLVNEQNGYSEAKKYASAIRRRTANRTMPPWLADNSGQCNTYEHARWLDDANITIIENWVLNGTPEGDAPTTPLPVPLLPGLTNPDSVAAMSTSYTPAGDPVDHPNDDYRCFIVDPNISNTTDQLLTAFEMQPGNDALVHHIILFGLPNKATEDAAIALDNADTKLGYTCFGGSGITANNAANILEPSFLAGWAPGTKLTEYPLGTGVKLVAGRKFIMQVHYNLANLDTSPGAANIDQTSVKLKYTATGGDVREAFVYGVQDGDLNIPPRVSDHLETGVTTVPFNARIWGAFPHMHTYGKSIDAYSSNASQGDSCLFDVPDWDFAWQQFFFYDKDTTVTINTGDTISLNCHYDTTSRLETDKNINWGDGTQDEMCLSFFYITLENAR